MDVIENSNKSISGDTRFDRVYEIRENDNNIVDIQRFKGKDLMVVIGSSWPTEEEFSLDFMATHPSCKFIIAPHNISQSAINQFINKSPLPVARYSELNKVTDINSLRVLVIDSIGLLSQIYKYADVTVIGGGFNAGIHNILEATVWGQPVMFGPKYRNFKEAQDLLTIGGALTFSDQDRFSEYLNILLENRERREEMSTLSAEYCLKNKGATQIVMETIGQYLID